MIDCPFVILFAGGGETLLQPNAPTHPRLRRSPSPSSSPSFRQPYFRSHGQTYRIKEGERVTMTCVVENLGEQEKLFGTVLRKKPSRIHMMIEAITALSSGAL